MKIATWNVNSLKVRLPQVLDWLETHRPDVLCLQETKLEDAAFPAAQIRAAGYHPLFSGQKTYNGVALLSREKAEMLATAIPGFRDEQKRVLASDVGGVRVVCVYVPNGEAVGSDKYRYKLDWLAAFTRWMKREVEHCPGLVLAGDVNIAPEPRDVHDPALWEGRVLHSEPERRAFRALLDAGFRDSFRLFPQPEGSYTWWDYRMNAFKRKMGLRIDHILPSETLAKRCKSCVIDKTPRAAERPSDHAPVVAEFDEP
ncbi:MAG: exodeoxyribonuclease III [Betaproteobacteria bacterium]|nr:exodeoxyribonuclease III [Betaproteobacteria bacterium]